jgi:chromosome segregation ATPase
MKRYSVFVLILILVFAVICINVISQGYEKKEEEIPPGMELKEFGKVRYLIPKGSEVRKEGGLVIVEDITKYTSRRFAEMEKRFAQIESVVKKDREEINKYISQKLSDVKQSIAKVKKEEEQIRKNIAKYARREFVQEHITELKTKVEVTEKDLKDEIQQLKEDLKELQDKLISLTSGSPIYIRDKEKEQKKDD